MCVCVRVRVCVCVHVRVVLLHIMWVVVNRQHNYQMLVHYFCECTSMFLEYNLHKLGYKTPYVCRLQPPQLPSITTTTASLRDMLSMRSDTATLASTGSTSNRCTSTPRATITRRSSRVSLTILGRIFPSLSSRLWHLGHKCIFTFLTCPLSRSPAT